MTRPLRVDVEGGWYHITARGTERRAIFCDKSYYRHFLELLEAMSTRYCVEVHAFCLLANHYHLVIRTPEANASKAMQWLNVSYGAWFNAKKTRVGHVFQGRFNSVLIDNDGSWLLIASEYLHLNPIRTRSMGLGKRANRQESKGVREPTDEQIKRRLDELREYEWSSYRAYAGYGAKPKWLHSETILKRSGGRKNYRQGVEQHVSRGADADRFECLRGRVAIGTTAFVKRAQELVGKVTKEQPDRMFVAKRVSFERIVKIVEEAKGQKWQDFGGRYGDHGRNMVLYLARMRSGLTLKEIGDAAGGIEYKTVGKAVKRFEQTVREDRKTRTLTNRCLAQMSTFET